jgi:two-component system nitrogen regulation sensor histidine kinase GlnL
MMAAMGAVPLRRAPADPDINTRLILDAVAQPVVLVDAADCIAYFNSAAEVFFGASLNLLAGSPLQALIPEDSPIFDLVHQARTLEGSVAQDSVALSSPRIGEHSISVTAAPLGDGGGAVVLTMHERSIASAIDRQLTHRGAARSVTAMASMLAHEVKNPLSGIRGAAQLLEQSASPDDRALTTLICKETDRICGLVDRMDVFADSRPLEREPVNIHAVLGHVQAVAARGFAGKVRFVERYDPSLPPVFGNHDQLVQVFLNLVKNAAEAAPGTGGEIRLATRYQHGVRLAVPGSDSLLDLPLLVSVEDNGHGVPEDLQPHLFDPFVTTKVKGTGLGLALVAKIVGEHGGVIDVDSRPGRTTFHVRLPTPPRPHRPAAEPGD